ncbi:MAG TPA: hypothetical protein VGB55_15695 [Tepidisphaeraceae bacterium]
MILRRALFTRCATGALLLCLAAAPATTQSTAPASRPVESAEAATILASAKAAYLAAETLAVEGTIRGDFDVANRTKQHAYTFTSAASGAGRFFHRIRDEAGRDVLIAASDGKQLTLYNARRNAYATLPASPERVPAEKLADVFTALMLDGDPSTLLLLCSEPDELLRKGATRIEADPAKADHPVLLWESADEKRRLIFDAGTKLLRQVEIDYEPLFKARDTNGFKRALVTIEYGKIAINEPVDEAQFAFKPPRTASEFVLNSELMQSDSASPATQPAE